MGESKNGRRGLADPADTAAARSGPALILASTSRYRAALLGRLGLRFDVRAPAVDETPGPQEAPAKLALRLAVAKAAAVARQAPRCWVLGSDQVAACDGRILGKPGTANAAREQLRLQSGRPVQFFTAVALAAGNAEPRQVLDTTTVVFRTLTDTEIDRYLQLEPALDCAGSFKCEGLGISLCAAIETRDPTALIGLPLIAVRELLAAAGYPLP
jgi:septum formation protein